MLEVRPFSFRDRRFREMLDRSADPDPAVIESAACVLAAVLANGGDGLLEQIRLYNSPAVGRENLRLSESEIGAARDRVSEPFLTALSLARVNMRKFHEYQRRRGYVHDDGDGVRLSRRVRPLSRIGVVCQNSCSALLMCAVPAQVAGVGQIALALPPDEQGDVDPRMAATARILGIDEIYRMSGAQAIAAFAYGPEPVARVDKIVGPGGGMADAAKRLVTSRVGVDAGGRFSELAIVADSGANAKFIAADMLAQAEQDAGNTILVLLTTDRLLAEAVRIELDRLADNLPNGEQLRAIVERHGGLFVCPSMAVAVDAANALAPARLGLLTRDNETLALDVDNAGLVYMGAWSSEAAAGGFSGANALAATGGTSRFASGPGVDDFVRETTVVEYSQERLAVAGRHLLELAGSEGAPARTEAVRQRLELLKWTSE